MSAESGSARMSILLVHRFAGFAGPRTLRAQWLEQALFASTPKGREGIDLLRWPTTHSEPADIAHPLRKAVTVRSLLGDQVARLLVDRHEPESRLRGRSVPTVGVDAGLIVSLPASPAVTAARRLAGAGIPYVVDQGDPWGIGAESFRGDGLASRRRRSLEIRMWERAAGGVFTTQSQADAVLDLVPDLPYLIRINGYRPLDPIAFAAAFSRRKKPDSILRLAHFGALDRRRVAVGPILASLIASGLWTRIEFTQFGRETGVFENLDLPAGLISLEAREPVPWHQAREAAAAFDAAIVFGNRAARQSQVPSKIVEYLTLPIPRIAISSGARGDELLNVARRLPGYLAVPATDPDLAEALKTFLARDWRLEELLPPDQCSWEQVAAEVVGFFFQVIGSSESMVPETLGAAPERSVSRATGWRV